MVHSRLWTDPFVSALSYDTMRPCARGCELRRDVKPPVGSFVPCVAARRALHFDLRRPFSFDCRRESRQHFACLA